MLANTKLDVFSGVSMFPPKPCFLSLSTLHLSLVHSPRQQLILPVLEMNLSAFSASALLDLTLKPLLLADYVGCSTFPTSEGMLHDGEAFK